jgi:hypothetical protein
VRETRRSLAFFSRLAIEQTASQYHSDPQAENLLQHFELPASFGLAQDEFTSDSTEVNSIANHQVTVPG